MVLMTMQGQVKLLKQEQQGLIDLVSKELTWKRVWPKISIITGLVEKV